MTDARHPERWLNDRRFLRLSGDAYKLHSCLLMWSVSNRTDGVIDDQDLALVPGVKHDAIDELVAAGLLERSATGDGWSLTEFIGTQTSRSGLEALEGQRRRDREKKARKRARAATEPTPDIPRPPAQSPGPSPGTSVGQARPGQDRPGPRADHQDTYDADDPWADTTFVPPGVAPARARRTA